MDWNADEWFVKHHADKLDDEFKAWWPSIYGYPTDHNASEDEQHEYWVRCAFALIGWKAKHEAMLPRVLFD